MLINLVGDLHQLLVRRLSSPTPWSLRLGMIYSNLFILFNLFSLGHLLRVFDNLEIEGVGCLECLQHQPYHVATVRPLHVGYANDNSGRKILVKFRGLDLSNFEHPS